MLPTFDLLYLFENQQIYILEIKRSDLPSDAVKSDIYKWMLIERENAEITSLDFLSIKSGAQQQERFFRQGYLSFDTEHAVYIRESSSVQNILRNKHPELSPESLVIRIQEQLSI